MRTNTLSLCFFLLLLFQPGLLFSQGNECADFPQGVNTLGSVCALRDDLVNGRWSQALDKWYSGARNRDLLDMVVYIDSAGRARVGLTKGSDTGHIFRGEKDIWVLVISDSSFLRDDTMIDSFSTSQKGDVTITDTSKPRDSTAISKEVESRPNEGSLPPGAVVGPLSEKDSKRIVTNEGTTIINKKIRRYSFKVMREALQYERGASENIAAGMLAMLLQLVSKSAGGLPQTPNALRDSTAYIELRPHHDANGATIFSGYAKFDLAQNTYNRIDVSPPQDLKFRSVQTHFGNYDNSTVSASIGVGVSIFAPRNNQFYPSHPDSGSVKLYLFGNIFVIPPKLPSKAVSLAFTLGTNILANIFDELIVGFRFGPGVVPIGIIVGADWKQWTDHIRRVGYFLGIDYSL